MANFIIVTKKKAVRLFRTLMARGHRWWWSCQKKTLVPPSLFLFSLSQVVQSRQRRQSASNDSLWKRFFCAYVVVACVMARFPVKREDQCQNLVLFFFPRKGWISCWQKFHVAVVHLDHPFSQQNKFRKIQFFWQGKNSPIRECEVSGGQKNRRETLRSDCQECGQTTKDGRTGLGQKKDSETLQMHGVPPIP